MLSQYRRSTWNLVIPQTTATAVPGRKSQAEFRQPCCRYIDTKPALVEKTKKRKNEKTKKRKNEKTSFNTMHPRCFWRALLVCTSYVRIGTSNMYQVCVCVCVCVCLCVSVFYLSVDIQHTQCPCRFFLPESYKLLWPQNHDRDTRL